MYIPPKTKNHGIKLFWSSLRIILSERKSTDQDVLGIGIDFKNFNAYYGIEKSTVGFYFLTFHVVQRLNSR